MKRISTPWGMILATGAAAVFAAPTVVLPADSPVLPKLIFIVCGSVLFAAAVVQTRAERPDESPRGREDAPDDRTP